MKYIFCQYSWNASIQVNVNNVLRIYTFLNVRYIPDTICVATKHLFFLLLIHNIRFNNNLIRKGMSGSFNWDTTWSLLGCGINKTNKSNLRHTIVTNGSFEWVTLLSVEVSFSEIIEQLSSSAICYILTTLYHPEQIIYVDPFGLVSGRLVHWRMILKIKILLHSFYVQKYM